MSAELMVDGACASLPEQSLTEGIYIKLILMDEIEHFSVNLLKTGISIASTQRG